MPAMRQALLGMPLAGWAMIGVGAIGGAAGWFIVLMAFALVATRTLGADKATILQGAVHLVVFL